MTPDDLHTGHIVYTRNSERLTVMLSIATPTGRGLDVAVNGRGTTILLSSFDTDLTHRVQTEHDIMSVYHFRHIDSLITGTLNDKMIKDWSR